MLSTKKIKIIALLMLLLTALTAWGCGTDKDKPEQSGSAFLTVTDDNGREVALAKRPERVISLSPSFLEPLHTAGVNLIARPSSRYAMPEFAANLPEIGATTNVNIEQVIALKPDLVIGYAGIHDKLVPLLESNNIPVLILKFKTYDEVLAKLALFGQLSGNTEAAEAAAAAMDARFAELKAKIGAAKPPRAAILHSTAKSVSVLLDGSIAGSTAKMLNITNIAAAQTAVNKAQDSLPFSLEALVEAAPDMIFIVSMGDAEEIKQRMNKEFAANPAWQTLTAVEKQHVYYLPQELFLLNPGLEYPKAAEVMARLAYPEVFNNE